MKLISSTSHMRSFVFGVEDSLVSTVGLLSGVAVAGVENKTIILTGVVLIFVEAFSMAVGNFLSDQSASEFEVKRDLPIWNSLGSSITMFVSYFVSGFIPLSPYIFAEESRALTLSVLVSLVALFVLGTISGKFSRVSALKSGFQMFFVGGMAVAIGLIVGTFLDK